MVYPPVPLKFMWPPTTPAMNNELRGIGESEGFVCFTRLWSIFMIPLPTPTPPIGGQFSTVPLYTLLATTTVHCSLFPSVYLKSKSSLRIKNLPPLPPSTPSTPSTRRWWMMTITLRKIFFMISNQQASVAYRLVAEEYLPLLFSSSDQEAA